MTNSSIEYPQFQKKIFPSLILKRLVGLITVWTRMIERIY